MNHPFLVLSPLIWIVYSTGAVLTMRWCERRLLGREGAAVAASLVWFLFWSFWTLRLLVRRTRAWSRQLNGLPRAWIRRG